MDIWEHDSPGEISEPLFVNDWKESGNRPIPGHNMGNLIEVERNYPDTYKRYTSLGPLLEKAGITGKGITWSSKEEYEFIKQLNGVITDEGSTKGMPKLETDIHAIESILSLAPESNGITSMKAWKALEKPPGLELEN